MPDSLVTPSTTNVDNGGVVGTNEPLEVNGEQLTEQQVIEQEAIARFNKAQTPDDGSQIPEGFNEDGTPIEDEGEVDWKARYEYETEKNILMAENDALYETHLGLFDPSDIIENIVQTKELSAEDRAELLSTGLTEEQIDEAYADIMAELNGEPPAEEGEEAEQQQQQQFSVKKYEDELRSNNGVLSEASYEELQAFGFSKQEVDSYIQGQRDIANHFANSLYDSVGGEEAYVELIEWSAKNIESHLVQDYVKAVETGDRERIKSSVEYMKMKYQSVNGGGDRPRRLGGNSDSYGGIQPFKDKTEWFKATGNRLYGRDASYTNMVDKRYLASRSKGIL